MVIGLYVGMRRCMRGKKAFDLIFCSCQTAVWGDVIGARRVNGKRIVTEGRGEVGYEVEKRSRCTVVQEVTSTAGRIRAPGLI